MDEVFTHLRAMMLEVSAGFHIDRDEPTDVVVHTTRNDAKTGKPEWFGAVMMKKNYVAFHIFPLYTDPSLGSEISDQLAKRRQGKSCFNFKKVDEVAFAELKALTDRAANAVRG